MAASAAAAAAAPSGQTCPIRILTWNIDGLDAVHDVTKRAAAVCDIIKTEKPAVVLLQEVVEESLALISEQLSCEYAILAPSADSQSYYTAVLTKFGVCETDEVATKVVEFDGSRMGRNLVIMSNILLPERGHRLAVCTSHLESLADGSSERVRQLRLLYQEIAALSGQHHAVLFGGDTNLRAAEVRSCPAPPGIENVWEKCGSPKGAKYTFDVKNNDNNIRKGWNGPLIQTQYDKMFWAPGKLPAAEVGCLVPNGFRLIGTEKLAMGCFPSDHFGIICNLS